MVRLEWILKNVERNNKEQIRKKVAKEQDKVCDGNNVCDWNN